MTLPAMELTDINGVELEIWDRGSGEPIVFVHGSMGDECFAVLTEPALADQYRLIHYHRRGWGQSEVLEAPLSIAQQAVDCKAVMQHVGVERAHFVGLSYGGVILLQMALDFPKAVHTLALLEPALPAVLMNSPEFGAALAEAASKYESGDKVGTAETFGQTVCGEGYRIVFDQTLPPGYFERWVEDTDTNMQFDSPAIDQWSFTGEEAAQISQPVLNMTGANTAPYFREIYETMRARLPHAENFVLPNASHCMLQMNPKGAAERLASFFSDHPLLE